MSALENDFGASYPSFKIGEQRDVISASEVVETHDEDRLSALEGESDRKLKILICLLYYVPHRTGLTIRVQRVAEELARRGHEVTVLTARYKLSLPRDAEMHNGVRVVRLWVPPIPISRGMVMPAYPWAALGL